MLSQPLHRSCLRLAGSSNVSRPTGHSLPRALKTDQDAGQQAGSPTEAEERSGGDASTSKQGSIFQRLKVCHWKPKQHTPNSEAQTASLHTIEHLWLLLDSGMQPDVRCMPQLEKVERLGPESWAGVAAIDRNDKRKKKRDWRYG